MVVTEYTGTVNTVFDHGEGIYNDQGNVNTVFDRDEGIYWECEYIVQSW